jgi:superfamily II DNA or RNA helicase
MIPTLIRRPKWIELLQGRDYLLDECHHHISPSYQKLKEKLNTTSMIGYTATPITPTGDGLGRAGFTRMVHGPEPRWLMDNGFLCDYDMYGAKAQMDIEGMKVRAGEYVQSEMEERILPVNGMVIRDWKKYNPDGHRTIAVGVSVEHCIELARLYNEAGISAAAVDGSTPRTKRKQIFADFRAGRITVLCACAVVDEGLDVPEATCLQLVRAIRSLRLHRQLIGRVLRPADGKDKAIIIDHGGSWRDLPAPDAAIEWSLKDKVRMKKKDAQSDRELEPGTEKVIPATRVVEGRDDLFLIRASTPQEVARERVQRSFKKAVRLYEKGILPSSAMRTQMRMAKFLDDDQLAVLSEICNLPPEWMENQKWLNRAMPEAVA